MPDKKDVRPGDVAISKGDGFSRGVVAINHGKVTVHGFEPRPFLNGVPELLKNAFNELSALLID